MLSGQILAHMGMLVQIDCVPLVPPRWQGHFLFGYKAMSGARVGLNARLVIPRNVSPGTAGCMKCWNG